MLKTECSLRCQSVRAYEASVDAELASAAASLVLVGSTRRTDAQVRSRMSSRTHTVNSLAHAHMACVISPSYRVQPRAYPQYKWLGAYDRVDGPHVNGRHVYAKRDDAEVLMWADGAYRWWVGAAKDLGKSVGDLRSQARSSDSGGVISA